MKTFIRKQNIFDKISSLIKLALGICLFWSATSHAQPVIVTPVIPTSPISKSIFLRALVSGRMDDAFYGTIFPENTSTGMVFTVNKDGSGYNVLHIFTAGERLSDNFSIGSPEAIVFPAGDGALYGTTPIGGSNGSGTIFTLHVNGSGYRILHDFSVTDSGPGTLIQGNDGALYGAGATIFRMNTDGGGYTVLHSFVNEDGSAPLGRLLQGNDGALYGTTYSKGTTNDVGTVFKINTNGTGFKVLHTFSDPGDGLNPVSGVIQGSDGALYGTTTIGGTANKGIVFKINTDGGGYAILHSFAGPPADGSGSLGELVQGLGGVLYGTTFAGGNKDNGTIFKIGLDGNGYNSLYSFTNSSPTAGKAVVGLIPGQTQADIGVLYGATSQGAGNNNPGTLFAMLVNPPAFITPVTGPTATNQTTVFWPEWAVNYRLQSTTNLSSTNWSDVTNGVRVTGVQVTSTNPAVFYRLASP